MKKLFAVLAAILFVTSVFAQSTVLPVSEKTHLICFQKVVQVDGTPMEVHNRCISAFLNKYYKNAASVVTGDDGSKIEGKHLFQMNCNEEVKAKCPWVNYKFIIEIRDGRIRYTLTDFTLKTPGSRFPIERWMDKDDPLYESQWDNYITQIAAFAENWGATLEEQIKPEKKVEDEEW